MILDTLGPDKVSGSLGNVKLSVILLVSLYCSDEINTGRVVCTSVVDPDPKKWTGSATLLCTLPLSAATECCGAKAQLVV